MSSRKFLVLILINSRKLPATLTTQMKSVGEVMAIGANFQESLQKAIRGLEIGRSWFKLSFKERRGFSAISEDIFRADT